MPKQIWIAISLVILICSSCEDKDSNQQEIAVMGFVFAPIQACIDPSKFIYHDRLQHAILSETQIKRISEVVASCGMSASSVWSGRVLYNNGTLFTVDIYFKPSFHSARLITGQHLYFSDFMHEESQADPDLPGYLQYLQKQPSGIERFTAKLPVYVYVPDRELTSTEVMAIPAASFVPFEWPEGFSDEEIIAIVDFVRSGPSIKPSDEQGYIVHYPDKVDLALPIMSIRRVNDHIEVETGTQEGPLAGSGQVLKIRKTSGGYELIAISMWLS